MAEKEIHSTTNEALIQRLVILQRYFETAPQKQLKRLQSCFSPGDMDTLQCREGHSVTSTVQRFLEAATPVGEISSHKTSLAAQLCEETISLFELILKPLLEEKGSNHPKETCNSLQRSCSRLKLWSAAYGICLGGLDDVLAKSQNLRHATLKILVSISRTLTERLPSQAEIELSSKQYENNLQRLNPLIEAAENDLRHDDTSSGDSCDYDSDSVYEVAEDLKIDTVCLMELDPLFQSPIFDAEQPREEREKSVAAMPSQDWSPCDMYSDMIGERFPEADDSIISRLGKASYDRYLRCQKDREYHATISADEGIQQPPPDGASSRFNDSGVGSSIPSMRSYAETIMSYRGAKGSSVRIPPLPAGAEKGDLFPCLACGKSIRAQNNSIWKRHLYDDLRPWQCLDVDCHFAATFSSRQDWVFHLAHDHGLEPEWKEFTCPLCLSSTGSGQLAITKHLRSHLEEISLATLPADIDSDTDSGEELEDKAIIEEEEALATPPAKKEKDGKLSEKSTGTLGLLTKEAERQIEAECAIIPGTTDEAKEKAKAKAWADFRPIITRLYITEGRTLAAVQEIMYTEYKFEATARLYKSHFHSWGIKKYNHKTLQERRARNILQSSVAVRPVSPPPPPVSASNTVPVAKGSMLTGDEKGDAQRPQISLRHERVQELQQLGEEEVSA
ncbi:hypothetical protein CEP51_009763 [Fusarium floridanum]|uniref:Clr5 domain-containing protein n=1 Tax=Fusarium floridanum TaxID=1325733 RepID=A0A428RGK4_9HYPO|nr:hypothetical protein CEP51_009763 [Fusarium floridanum]